MVSLWPFRGDGTSPASFEKTLSRLSAKINANSSKQSKLRQSSRRIVLFITLYGGFAYVLCAAILLLVVGWRSWSAAEYTGMAGAPPFLFLIRYLVLSYYDFRTSSLQNSLEQLEQQRNDTIEKLKSATKYNSTQELLNKYGGSPSPKQRTPSKKGDDSGQAPTQGQNKRQQLRTSFVPPPTANIPGRIAPSNSGTPHQGQTTHPSPGQTRSSGSMAMQPGAEFAPNAFTSPRQYAQNTQASGPTWVDRVMDVLLGEDESLPSKRIALICQSCRLINGQAPPGAKTVEDVGRWRCAACGAWNGEESEVSKAIAAAAKMDRPKVDSGDSSGTGGAEGEEQEAQVDGEDSDVTIYSSEEEAAAVKATGSTAKESTTASKPESTSGRAKKRSTRSKAKTGEGGEAAETDE